MFPTQTLEFQSPKKLNSKLSLCYPTKSLYIQPQSGTEPQLCKYGIKLPYGVESEDQMKETDAFVIDLDVNETAASAFDDLDASVLTEARKFQSRVTMQSTVKVRDDNTKYIRCKAYDIKDLPCYDANDHRCSAEEITRGAYLIALLKVGSLWMSGSECGLTLRLKKCRIAGYKVDEPEVVPDFV